MSKFKSNVHPGYYKVAGRGRQGEDIIHDRQKLMLAQSHAIQEHQAPYPKHVPEFEDKHMPEKETLDRARLDKREGKSASTQAGEFVREEIHHVREGKHGARSTKQAIAIGLSKARRAGVKLGVPSGGSKSVRKQAARDAAKGRHPGRKPSPKRSRAVLKALKREGHSAASHAALARQARSSARRRS